MESRLLDDENFSNELMGPDGDYKSIRSMNMKELWDVFWMETVKLWEIGGPIAFNILCQYGLYAITVVFCGHLGPTELSAVSIAQTVIATFVYGLMDGWKGWSWSAFNEMWAFVRLSIESAIMICLETWYMISIVLLTGHLKDAVTAVGSLSICTIVDEWQAMFFLGVNAAISARVSNELGLGRARATKYSVYVTVFQSLLIGILCMIVVLAVRNHLAILFTNNEVLIRAVSELARFLGVTMLLNSVQAVISGVAVGGGWQGLVACINLGSYYAFGIPLGYILGYVANLGVMGLWGGMIGGLALQTLLLSFVIYRIDWNKEVEQTKERIQIWGAQDLETEKTQNPKSPMSHDTAE